MKRVITSILLLFSLSASTWAKWALIPLEELVADSDLIVIGTLHSEYEDSEGLGRGYILVERIITKGVKTLDNTPLRHGDNLKIEWADNWACASGMHLRRVGQKGIWLLKVEGDGTVRAGYPGRFLPLEDLGEIERLLKKKQITISTKVDVEIEQSRQNSVLAPEFSSEVTVDITPFDKHSAVRAILVSLFFLGLYLVLYKSRLRIR